MANEAKKVKRPTMTLYQCPYYRSFKVLWLIHELDAVDDFKLVKLDSVKSKNSPEHLEYKKNVHPHGTIPGLVIDGDGTMIESSAMCLYLADKYGKLVPPVHNRKAYYDWSMYASTTLDEIMEFLYWQWCSTSKKTDPEGVDKMVAKCEIGMQRLTETLENGGPYICGEEFTAADCILGYGVDCAGHDMFNKGRCLQNFPVVKEYLKRLVERPAYIAANKMQFV